MDATGAPAGAEFQVNSYTTNLQGSPAVAADAPAQPAAQEQAKGKHNQAQLWRDARSGQAGLTTVRGPETGVLILSGGETWRELRNGPITLYGGILLCVVVVAIGAERLVAAVLLPFLRIVALMSSAPIYSHASLPRPASGAPPRASPPRSPRP